MNKKETISIGRDHGFRPGQRIILKRSKLKQLLYVGTIYSMYPPKPIRLNMIEKINQSKLVQYVLRRTAK